MVYRRPPRLQFGLKSLLAAVTAVCLLLGLAVRSPQLFAATTCGAATTALFVLLAWIGTRMESVAPWGYLGALIANVSIVLAIFCGLVTLLLGIVLALWMLGLA